MATETDDTIPEGTLLTQSSTLLTVAPTDLIAPNSTTVVNTPVVEPVLSYDAQKAADAKDRRANALTEMEQAMKKAIHELEHEGVVAMHGIEDEYKALKGFVDYKLHQLKGKLGLL